MDAASRGRMAEDVGAVLGVRLMRAASWLREGIRGPEEVRSDLWPSLDGGGAVWAGIVEVDEQAVVHLGGVESLVVDQELYRERYSLSLGAWSKTISRRDYVSTIHLSNNHHREPQCCMFHF